MKIVNKKITDLKPYEKNPRKNDGAVDAVANSIKEFGFKVPIIITKEGEIVAGHTRYKAAQQLELEEVPCIVADDLTPQQIKAFRIADNKTAELAVWDDALLGEEMKLLEDDFDFTDFGFNDFELRIMTEDFNPTGYDKEIEEAYSANEGEYLSKKRVIIVYNEDDEEALAGLLGLDTPFSKIIYKYEELKNGE